MGALQDGFDLSQTWLCKLVTVTDVSNITPSSQQMNSRAFIGASPAKIEKKEDRISIRDCRVVSVLIRERDTTLIHQMN